MVIFEEEAKIVRLVFDMFVVEMRSLNAIARHLNELKVPPGTRSNSRTGWSAGRVRIMLKNPKYCGIWSWGANHAVKYEGIPESF